MTIWLVVPDDEVFLSEAFKTNAEACIYVEQRSTKSNVLVWSIVEIEVPE